MPKKFLIFINKIRKFIILLIFPIVLFSIIYEGKSSEIKIETVTASSIQENNNEFKPANIIDDNLYTRWSSEFNEPEWVILDLGEKKTFDAIIISWEKAYAKKYEIQISDDSNNWTKIYAIENGDGEDDVIYTGEKEARYIKIYCIERATEWGFSIYEVKVLSDANFLKNDKFLPKPKNPKGTYLDNSLPIEKRVNDLLKRMSIIEKIEQIYGKNSMDCRSNERLGIPPLLMTDGPHGIRGFGKASCFPLLITTASWNEDLMKNVGIAIGKEAILKARNIVLGPCINIHRTPLGGRNFESLSEDPYLISRMTVAYIKGLQSQGVGACVKHFACNNQEYERNRISVEISERALREIYLPGFEKAVKEANVLGVMAAYNKINGYYCCENFHLLQDILKNEWGFKGFVVSDWGAIHNTVNAFNSGCDIEMPGPGRYFTKIRILSALANREISEKLLDEKVKRILYVKFSLGLFDKNKIKNNVEINTNFSKELAYKIAEEGITLLKNEKELLPLDIKKFNSIGIIGSIAENIPIDGGGSSEVDTLYVINPLDVFKNELNNKIKINYAKGYIMPNEVSVISEKSFRLHENVNEYGLKGEYFNNINLSGNPILVRTDKEINFNWEWGSPATNIKRNNFSIRWSGKLLPPKTGNYKFQLLSDDGSRLFINDQLIIDNWGDHGPEIKTAQFYLEKNKEYNIKIEYYEKSGGAMIKFGWITPDENLENEAIEIAKKSEVVLIFAGLNKFIESEGFDRKDMNLPIEQEQLIEKISEVNTNIILILINGSPIDMKKWYHKISTIVEAYYPGPAGSKAIFDVIIGKINPSGKLPFTFPKSLEDNPSYENYPGDGEKVYYKEDIFVGYRYYDTKNIEPLFPFGFGLSYTKFEYKDLKIKPEKIKKGGKVYISFKIKNMGKMEGKEIAQLYISKINSKFVRALKELKGFKKINLRPKEEKEIMFKIDSKDLAIFHPENNKWYVEPGEYEILIGSSSKDIKLKGRFKIITNNF